MSATTRRPRSANRSAAVSRLGLSRSDPSIASVDKEEPYDQPNEEPRETERDGEAEKRSEPEPDCRTDQHRGDQKPARGRRVGPGRGTRIHRDVDGHGLAIAVVSGTKRDEEPP